MGANEARIRIGIDGANDVRNALRLIKGDFSQFGTTAESVGNTLKGVATGFARLGVDIAKAANNMKAIDFGQAAEKYKALDDQITRMAIRGGKDIDALKAKMRDFGKQAGVSTGEFAGTVKQFDRNTFAGLDESAEAMRSLGVYAEDTDRALEEMIEFGSELWTKLGIPAQRLEGELRKIQTIAGSTNLATGFLGLEDSIKRLLPLMAQMQGGTTRGGATVATIQKLGYSKDVSEELYQRIYGTFGGEQRTHLVRQIHREMGGKGDPYTHDSTGRRVPSRAALRNIHKYLAKKTFYGRAQYFGGGAMGEEAAIVEQRINEGDVDRLEDEAELKDNLQWLKERRQREEQETTEEGLAFAAKRGQRIPISDAAKRLLFTTQKRSRYSGTASGGRRERERAREIWEEDNVGKGVTGLQDERVKSMTTGQRAVADTVTGYMPGVVQDVAHLGSAVNSLNSSVERLGSAMENLPGKVGASVKSGIEGADVRVKPAVNYSDFFDQKNRARTTP